MHAVFRDMTEEERTLALLTFLRSVPFNLDGTESDTFREIAREVLGFPPAPFRTKRGAHIREICPLGAACYARWKVRGDGEHEYETLPLYPTERAAADILLPGVDPGERERDAKSLIDDYIIGRLDTPARLAVAFGVPLPEGLTWAREGHGPWRVV